MACPVFSCISPHFTHLQFPLVRCYHGCFNLRQLFKPTRGNNFNPNTDDKTPIFPIRGGQSAGTRPNYHYRVSLRIYANASAGIKVETDPKPKTRSPDGDTISVSRKHIFRRCKIATRAEIKLSGNFPRFAGWVTQPRAMPD